MNNDLEPQPSWWKRNWKWVVPVGGCLTILVLVIFFIGSLFYGITSVIEDSQPYEYALEKINQDDQLIEILGSPIEKNGMVQGTINWHNGKKRANLKIPVKGPKEKGILYINASGEGDNWTYHEIRVEINENDEIDLLEEDWQ